MATIDIPVQRLDQLFIPPAAAPLHERALNRDAETHIVERAGELLELIAEHVPDAVHLSTKVTNPDFGEVFLFRGDAVDGINEYAPFPKFREGYHMEFRGSEAWK